MENIELSQKELVILTNLLYRVGASLNIPDIRLLLPILDKLEAKIKEETKEESKEEVKEPVFPDKETN